MSDLRCDSGIKFGEVTGEARGLLEVKCRSFRCGHGLGVVVIHRFDLSTQTVLKTLRFKDISKRKKVNSDGSSLRSA